MTRQTTTQWKLVIGGFTMLLCAAFVDNIRGPLLPIFKATYALNYTQTSTFLVVGYIAAISCLFFLIPLLNRWGEYRVCSALCGLGMLALFFAGWVKDYQGLLLLGLFLGFLISTYGTLCNVLIIRGTEPAARTRTLCALHTMYGTGSFLAPVVVTFLLESELSWKWTLWGLPPVFIAITFALLSQSRSPEFTQGQAPQSARVGVAQLLFMATMAAYVAAEVILSAWMTGYLVESLNWRVSQATPYVGGFFFVMAITRVGCLFFLRPRFEWVCVWVSLILASTFFILGRAGFLWAFVLAGTLGPFFPILFGKMSEIFPTQWRSLTVLTIAGMQFTLGLSHFVVGAITDAAGMDVAFWTPLVFFGMTAISLGAFIRVTGRQTPSTLASKQFPVGGKGLKGFSLNGKQCMLRTGFFAELAWRNW